MLQADISPFKKKLNLVHTFRGLAAILVVLFHLTKEFREQFNYTYSTNPLELGFSGVDFFFILSGFIIFYMYYPDLGERRKVKIFLIRRIARIYPIYWVILLTTFIFRIALPALARNANFDLGYIIQAILLIPQKGAAFVGVSWTLSYELLFYGVFALLIYFKPRFHLAIAGSLLAGILLNLIGIIRPLTQSYFILEFIFEPINLEFYLGCLAAYLVVNRKLRFGKFYFFLGLFLLALSIAFNSEQARFLNYADNPVRPLVFGLPFMFLIMGAASIDLDKPTAIPWILTYFGNASYSIYLTNGSVLTILALIILKIGWLQSTYWLLLALVMLVITVVIGCMIYSLIEKPLTGKLRRELELINIT